MVITSVTLLSLEPMPLKRPSKIANLGGYTTYNSKKKRRISEDKENVKHQLFLTDSIPRQLSYPPTQFSHQLTPLCHSKH
jgi:hypothetical protein